MMKLIVCGLVTVLFVNGQTYNYDNQGGSWITSPDADWTCAGTKQSPYLFESASPPTSPDTDTLAIYSHEDEADFSVIQALNNYIEVIANSSKDTLTYASVAYTLEKYIVRGHAEHPLGGTTAAPDYSVLEIQSFFKNGSKYVVLSLLVDGEGSADLAFVDNLADETRLDNSTVITYTSTNTQLDFLGQGMKAFRALSDPNFYKYVGSLTYPPCTEDVIWLIGSKPIQVPVEKLTQLQNKVQYKDTFTGATATDVHGNWREIPPPANQADIDSALINSAYEYTTGDAFFAVPATSVLLVTLAALMSTVG